MLLSNNIKEIMVMMSQLYICLMHINRKPMSCFQVPATSPLVAWTYPPDGHAAAEAPCLPASWRHETVKEGHVLFQREVRKEHEGNPKHFRSEFSSWARNLPRFYPKAPISPAPDGFKLTFTMNSNSENSLKVNRYIAKAVICFCL